MRELLNNDSLLAITEKMLGKKIGKDNIYKIQQAGTKYVGHVYFDVADDFLYECIVQTTGTTNTTANFKKCGIGENRDKLDNLLIKDNNMKQYTFTYAPRYDVYEGGYRFMEILCDATLYDENTIIEISYGSAKPTAEIAIFSLTTMNYYVSKCAYLSNSNFLADNFCIIPKDSTLHTRPFNILLPIQAYTRICIKILSTSEVFINKFNTYTYHKNIPSGAIPMSRYINATI